VKYTKAIPEPPKAVVAAGACGTHGVEFTKNIHGTYPPEEIGRNLLENIITC